MNDDPELLKNKTRDDEIEKRKCKTKKHDYEKTSKSLKIDNDYFRKK